MQYRWLNVRQHVDSKVSSGTTFIGGTGLADLWVVPKTNVLICQYEHEDDYVSYHPISAVWADAKGEVYGDNDKYAGMDVRDIDANIKWGNWEHMGEEGTHKPADIARYLAVFYPDAFTEAQRAEVLGTTLAETGKTGAME